MSTVTQGLVPELGPEPAVRPGIGGAQLADCPTVGKGRSNSPDPCPNSLCQTAWLPTPLFTQATKPQGVTSWSSLSLPVQLGARQALTTPTQATLTPDPGVSPKISPQPESPTFEEGLSHWTGHEQAQLSLWVTNPQLPMSPPTWVVSSLTTALLGPGALLDSHHELSILQSAPNSNNSHAHTWPDTVHPQEHLSPSAHCLPAPSGPSPLSQPL